MRAVCSHCLRPQVTCICDLKVSVNIAIKLIVLQHPHEVAHPKGSAPLVSMCFNDVETHIGEIFDPAMLGLSKSNSLLLYPPNKNESDKIEASKEVVKEVTKRDELKATYQSKGIYTDIKNSNKLIVIDSTWRKSRRILHLNPWLASVPRVGVEGKVGNYHIRKAEIEGQLSTFESVVHVLADAQHITASDQNKLIHTFTEFNRRIAAFSPHHTQIK